MDIVFEITGRIPSKKNSRISTRSGRSFPSKKYTEWHKDAMIQISDEWSGEPIEYVEKIVLAFKMPDNRRKDLTNCTESVMDLLVDAGILKDDCWQVIPNITLMGMLDSESPGCIIGLYGTKQTTQQN